MFIEGIGKVTKKEVLSIFADDIEESIKEGVITKEEIAKEYKLHLVQKASIIGTCGDTFNANYNRIPEDLKDKLTPSELASLVDAFYKCYGDGKRATVHE